VNNAIELNQNIPDPSHMLGGFGSDTGDPAESAFFTVIKNCFPALPLAPPLD
jgi:hypothetical protein